MEIIWRFRIMLFMAIVVLIFGDFLGYGNVKGDKHGGNVDDAHGNKYANPSTDIKDKSDKRLSTDSEEIELKKHFDKKSLKKISAMQMSKNLRESCLPKMLCEIAAKPFETLSDKERGLLDLIRSTTLSLTWQSAPTKWHFAAHMGQLMKYTADSLSGAMGCSQLWPQCPYSSQKLLSLSSKIIVK